MLFQVPSHHIERRSLLILLEAITLVALSSDNKYIVVAGQKDKNIRVFDFVTKKLTAIFSDVHKGMTYISLSIQPLIR